MALKLDKTEAAALQTHLLAQIAAARKWDDSKREDRDEAWKLLLGEGLGDEVPGLSQVVSPDSRDAVLSVLPDILEIFFGAGDPVTIKHRRTSAMEAAKRMRSVIRYRLQRQLNMFMVAYDWFFDALVFRNGILQYSWDFNFSWEEKEYQVITAADLAEKLWDGGEVILQGQPIGAIDANGMTQGWQNCKIKERVIHRDQPMLRVIPRGNFLISPDAQSIDDAQFLAVRDYPNRLKFEEDAKAFDYNLNHIDLSDSEGDEESAGAHQERGREDPQQAAEYEPKNGPVERYACYLRWRIGGEAKAVIATMAGNKLVHVVENVYQRPNFIDLTPVRLPHQFEGLSMIDLVKQYQSIKTAMWRLVLDYFNENVFPQTIAERDSGVNMNSILMGRRVIEVDAGKAGSIRTLDKPPIGWDVYRLIEMFEGAKEQSSGVSRLNQGLQADSINKTARGLMELIQQAGKRLRMIARLFAEMGLKPLYRAMIWMEQEFCDRELVVSVSDTEDITINPGDLGGDFDLVINVGSGNADKHMVIQQMQMLMKQMAELTKSQVGQGMFKPRHLYNMNKQIIEAMGFDPILFIDDPDMEAPGGPQATTGGLATGTAAILPGHSGGAGGQGGMELFAQPPGEAAQGNPGGISVARHPGQG